MLCCVSVAPLAPFLLFCVLFDGIVRLCCTIHKWTVKIFGMLGDYDMILYLNARNPQELNDSIELFKRDIGPYVIHYDLLVQDRVHHWRQFSSGIYKQLRGK